MNKLVNELAEHEANKKKAFIPISPEELTKIQPIHSATDNQITDETLIYHYKGTPVFIDFLHVNDEENNYFKAMKSSLTSKKWGAMKEKDKIYYLYNKNQYYIHLVKIKEESKNKYEKMIENKSKEIKSLQELIHEKETTYEKSGGDKQVDILSKNFITFYDKKRRKTLRS
jgi:hypothetical protein